MQKKFKVAALAGALSIAISGSVIANPNDLGFDGWTVDNGTIDYLNADVCATDGGYKCSVIAEGAGFAQVKVDNKDAGGDSYVMTIVTDQNASTSDTMGSADLGFSDISFIRMKITLGVVGDPTADNVGMKGRQLINEFKDNTNFESKTFINTGWAEVGANNPLSIIQTLKNDGLAGTVGDDFESGFTYKSTNDASGVRNGYTMDINQVAGLASLNDPLSDNDSQTFTLRQRQGTFVESGGSVGFSTPGAGRQMAWDEGDDIKAMWMGQKITSMSSFFGYLSYDNKDDVHPAGATRTVTDESGNTSVVSIAGESIAPIADFNLTKGVSEEAWGDWNSTANVAAFGNKPCEMNPEGNFIAVGPDPITECSID